MVVVVSIGSAAEALVSHGRQINAEVGPPPAAVVTRPAGDRGGHDDPLSDGKPLDRGPDGIDCTGELVADHHGGLYLRVSVYVRFQIGPADRAGVNRDADLILTAGGNGNGLHRDGPGPAVDNGLHLSVRF